MKLSAYPFTKYGLLEGTVTTISADESHQAPTRVDGAAATPVRSDAPLSPFKARVTPTTQQLKCNKVAWPILAGMQVVPEIRQGERTVLEYLLSPVRRVANEAGGEG